MPLLKNPPPVPARQHGARAAALACAASLLCGCATTTQGPAFAEAPQPAASAGLATVYFYRTGNWNAEYGGTRLFINDQEVAALKQDGYTWVQLEPGDYVFEENRHWSSRPLGEDHVPNRLRATVAVEDVRYVAIDISATNIRMVDTVTMVMIGDVPVPIYGKEKTGDDTVAVRFEAAPTGLAHLESRKFQAHDY